MNISSETLAQLSKFSTFANANSTNNPKAVAKLDGAGADGITGVSRNANDAPKTFLTWMLRRSEQNQNSNKATRDLFLKTISDIFGGAEKIPFRVRDAMQMDGDKDRFGSNNDRPLTARRIKAVISAVGEHISFSTDKTFTVGGNEISKGSLRDYVEGESSYQLEGMEDTGLINGNGSINDAEGDEYENFIENSMASEAPKNTQGPKIEEEPKIEKQPKKNDNVSSNPNTFGGKLKMFQKSGVVFGQAGFVSGQGNRVMNGLATGPKIVKEEKKEGEDFATTLKNQTDQIKVVNNKKKKIIKSFQLDD